MTGRATIVAAALCCAAWLCGCGGAQQPEAGQSAVAGQGAEAESVCLRYGRSLCEEVGDDSPTCLGTMSAVRLMPPAACEAGLADMEYTRGRVGKLRKVCDAVVVRLCDAAGEDSRICAMARRDLPNVPAGHCESLLLGYRELLSAMERRLAVSEPLAPEAWDALLAGNPPSVGPRTARVVLVVFSDFQCPFCGKAATVVDRLKQRYPTDLRFVFRHFPLGFHKYAHLASEAAMASHAQGKFWPYHDLLFEHQDALGRADLERYAQQLDLDLTAFRAALDGGAHVAAVDGDYALGERVNVQGTPSMFVNGARVADPTDFDSLAAAVDTALAE